MPPRVTILVPVYNEQSSIEPVLRAVWETEVGDKEIVVVDDGSDDQTGAILARLRREFPLRVITHPKNRGKGQAIQTGLAQCRGEIVLLQDADFECDPRHYRALLAPFSDPRTTVVYGSRYLSPSHPSPPVHRLANWVITAWVNLLFGSSLTDAETGYKLFRRTIVERIPLRAQGFEFEVEFTCKALRLGHAIREVPVVSVRRTYAEGKKITWKDGLVALWVIVRCRLDPHY